MQRASESILKPNARPTVIGSGFSGDVFLCRTAAPMQSNSEVNSRTLGLRITLQACRPHVIVAPHHTLRESRTL